MNTNDQTPDLAPPTTDAGGEAGGDVPAESLAELKDELTNLRETVEQRDQEWAQRLQAVTPPPKDSLDSWLESLPDGPEGSKEAMLKSDADLERWRQRARDLGTTHAQLRARVGELEASTKTILDVGEMTQALAEIAEMTQALAAVEAVSRNVSVQGMLAGKAVAKAKEAMAVSLLREHTGRAKTPWAPRW